MIDTDYLSQEIENELNAIASNDGIKFKIHSSVGDYKTPILNQANGTLQSYINGVLRMLDGDYASLSDIEDLFAEYLLEIAVKQEDKDLVESTLKAWVLLRLGQTDVVTSENTTYILTPTPPKVGMAKDAGKLGAMVTYSINVKVQSIKNGVLSNMVHWYFKTDADYVEIKRLRASFVSTRTPNDMPKANENVTCCTNAYASHQISFEVPYVMDNDILQKIEQDIFMGNKDQIYTIKRQWGSNPPIEDDYVLSSGTINEEDGTVVGMQLIFSRTVR